MKLICLFLPVWICLSCTRTGEFPPVPVPAGNPPIQTMVNHFDHRKTAEEALSKADRLYRTQKSFSTDSLLLTAFRYYKTKGTSAELTRLYFYLGVYHEDKKQLLEALRQYTLAGEGSYAVPDTLFQATINRKILKLQQKLGKYTAEDMQWKFRYEDLQNRTQKLYASARWWRTACFIMTALFLFLTGTFRYKTLRRKRELFETQLLIERLQRAEEELKEKMSQELNEKDGKLKDFFRLRVEMIKEFVEFSRKYINNPEKMKDKFQRTISTDSFSPADWTLLREGVNITGNGILDYLGENYPDLTEENLRYCALICAGFETDELAILWDINNDSIYKRRTRLRQKLGLAKNQDLKKFFDELTCRLK